VRAHRVTFCRIHRGHGHAKSPPHKTRDLRTGKEEMLIPCSRARILLERRTAERRATTCCCQGVVWAGTHRWSAGACTIVRVARCVRQRVARLCGRRPHTPRAQGQAKGQELRHWRLRSKKRASSTPPGARRRRGGGSCLRRQAHSNFRATRGKCGDHKGTTD